MRRSVVCGPGEGSQWGNCGLSAGGYYESSLPKKSNQHQLTNTVTSKKIALSHVSRLKYLSITLLKDSELIIKEVWFFIPPIITNFDGRIHPDSLFYSRISVP